MRSLWKMAALTGAALVLAGGMAFAQGPGPGGGMGQGMGQGQGTGRGMGPGAGGQGILQWLDTNGDGAVSRDEFINAPRGGPGSATDIAKEHRAARFKQFDRNGDGKLTADEFQAGGYRQ
ncbi:EF-hand domain-containing protein [Azospirillum thermophilum]|uniref:EF-hand domain-containing protein n=1 Tax=Azospirillum thermophilum TaxID=2202148 RepID=UPI00143D4E73|nr:EF-hand domain-containing protein [Azospirillum thermophilum]